MRKKHNEFDLRRGTEGYERVLRRSPADRVCSAGEGGPLRMPISLLSRPSSGPVRKCRCESTSPAGATVVQLPPSARLFCWFGACVWNKKALLFLTGEKKDKTPLDFQAHEIRTSRPLRLWDGDNLWSWCGQTAWKMVGSAQRLDGSPPLLEDAAFR
ncbi:hypothetical protein GN956_G10715 [Arapaima gigas]